MISTLAEVIDTKPHQLVVRCQQKSACSACASRDTCATNTVANALSTKAITLSVPCEQQIAVGSIIEIGMQEQVLVKSALLLYLLPLLFFIVAALISHVSFANEAITMLTSLIAGGGGFYFAKRQTVKLETHISSQPRFIRLIK